MRWLALLATSFSLAACAGGALQQPTRSSAYADFLIGRVASLRQDHTAAAERYHAALARSPHDPALIDGALTAALATGDVARAREVVRGATSSDAPAYVYLVRAVDALVAGHAREAERALDAVDGGGVQELTARFLKVWVTTEEGRVDEVVSGLAPFATIRPYGAMFAYQQAMVLDSAGRGDEALQSYQVAAHGGLWLPAGIERHADLLARRGERDQALALLDAEANRGNPALVAARARFEVGEGVSAQPLTTARGAAIALFGLAAIYQQERNETAALATLTLANMLDPGLDGARLSFAQVQSDLGHTELAQGALAQIGAGSPYAASARAMRAWSLLGAGDQEGALALMRADAETGDERAARTLGEMYRQLQRYGEAEPIYSDLIARDGDDWRLFFFRGAVRERLGRWPEAEADFQHALELSPDEPDVLNYLGYTWVDRGERVRDGLAMIERAVALRPQSGAIIDSLGWAHYRLGDYARALDLLERAAELDPGDPTLNEHLGDVYWRVGRRVEARFQWRRALTLTPDNPAAIETKLNEGLPAEPVQRTSAR